MNVCIGARAAAGECRAYEELQPRVASSAGADLGKDHIRKSSRDLTLRRAVCFSYFEYLGQTTDADMAAMAADPAHEAGGRCCNPRKRPVDGPQRGRVVEGADLGGSATPIARSALPPWDQRSSWVTCTRVTRRSERRRAVSSCARCREDRDGRPDRPPAGAPSTG